MFGERLPWSERICHYHWVFGPTTMTQCVPYLVAKKTGAINRSNYIREVPPNPPESTSSRQTCRGHVAFYRLGGNDFASALAPGAS